jgi:hypothetical protein
MKRLSALVPVMFTLGILLAVMPAFAQENNLERNAYFGDEHIHTSGRWTPGFLGTAKKFLSLWGTTPACASPARDRGHAIQQDGGIYEDESSGNGGFGCCTSS